MEVLVETAPAQETSPTQELAGPYQPEAPESIHLEAEEAVQPPQTHQSVEPEDLETGPAVRSVQESLSADVFLNGLNAVQSETGYGSDLQLGDLFCDLNVNLIQVHTSSDILPTLPTCVREGFPLSESLSEQSAFEVLSELPPSSGFFRYCENSHLAADIDCLDQRRASTPVQEGSGVSVSKRFFPNLCEILLSNFIGSVNDRGDRLENLLNFKISELAKFDKDLETNLVREIVETQRQNHILLNLVRAHSKSFTLYKSLQSYRSLTTRRDIIEFNKKQDVIIDFLTRLVNTFAKKD